MGKLKDLKFGNMPLDDDFIDDFLDDDYHYEQWKKKQKKKKINPQRGDEDDFDY